MEAGGVSEVVHDGVNGLLVGAGDTAALGDAVRRYFADDELRERLRAGRRGVSGRLCARTRLRRARGDPPANRGHVKPRVLFVSRRVELPLSPSLARKWDAIGAELDFRVLAGGSGEQRRVPSGARVTRARRPGVLRGAAPPHRA